MLKMSTTQISILKQQQKSIFIDKTKAFLQENVYHWYEKHDENYIFSHINKIIELCHGKNIHKGINIQKILYSCIKYELELPLLPYYDWQLTKHGFDENYRVQSFIAALQCSNNPLKITLETDLRSLKSACTFS